MKKNYVLDTNVLLHDPHAIFRFEDNNVIIPIYVIEEVDQFKREGSERGRNAGTIARVLDELREQGGSLAKGVALDSGGTLRVAVPTQAARAAERGRPHGDGPGHPADGVRRARERRRPARRSS